MNEGLVTPERIIFNVLRRDNYQLKKEIQLYANAYRSAYSIDFLQRTQICDSLVKEALAGHSLPDSLRIGLQAQIKKNPETLNKLAHILPSRVRHSYSAEVSLIQKQNDSLRQQLALKPLFYYFYINVVADLSFDKFYPVLSITTICPPTSQAFKMDIFLSPNDTYWPEYWENYQINVDGLPVSVTNGIAHLERTFSAPGIYPIKIEGRVSNDDWRRDSSIYAEKTFYLHVTQ